MDGRKGRGKWNEEKKNTRNGEELFSSMKMAQVFCLVEERQEIKKWENKHELQSKIMPTKAWRKV